MAQRTCLGRRRGREGGADVDTNIDATSSKLVTGSLSHMGQERGRVRGKGGGLAFFFFVWLQRVSSILYSKFCPSLKLAMTGSPFDMEQEERGSERGRKGGKLPAFLFYLYL